MNHDSADDDDGGGGGGDSGGGVTMTLITIDFAYILILILNIIRFNSTHSIGVY